MPRAFAPAPARLPPPRRRRAQALRALARVWLLALPLPALAADGAEPVAVATPPAAASAASATPAAPALQVPAPRRLAYTIYGHVSFLPYRASGELQWTHADGHYEARMEVGMFLLGSRVQESQGRITPAGLRPQHFVDRVKDDRTVDFDYARGLVRFSEGTPPQALPGDAQDHLSVFMQLGSLIGSAPQRYPKGTALTLPAMGIYGPESWRFVVGDTERLHLPGGDVDTLKLSRPANRADEPNAEVWLAPALGWLPARIRLSQPNGDYIDQRWAASSAP